jgi:hypothetical protein
LSKLWFILSITLSECFAKPSLIVLGDVLLLSSSDAIVMETDSKFLLLRLFGCYYLAHLVLSNILFDDLLSE